jgi:hypothetical protein
MQTRSFAASRFVLRRGLLPLLAVAGLGLTGLSLRASTLLEYWDFNNDASVFNASASPSTFGSFSTTGTGVATGSGNGEIYNATSKTLSSNSVSSAVYTNGILDLNGLAATTHANGGAGGASNAAPVWGVYTNSTGASSSVTNQAATDPTAAGGTASNGGSLGLVNAANETDSLVFTLTSTGYTGLTFSAAERFSATNLATITWSYSTDDVTWTTVTASGSPGSNFTPISLSLPGGIGNLSTFYVKESLQFGAATGSFAIDNVQLTGNSAAVPEPTTVALLVAGGLLLVWRVRRRAAWMA